MIGMRDDSFRHCRRNDRPPQFGGSQDQDLQTNVGGAPEATWRRGEPFLSGRIDRTPELQCRTATSAHQPRRAELISAPHAVGSSGRLGATGHPLAEGYPQMKKTLL